MKLEGDSMEVVNNFINYSTEIISNGGLLFGILIIILESWLPILPLGVFVALNIQAFGFFIGITISWAATCIGCYISYLLFSCLSKNVIDKYLWKKSRKNLEKGINTFYKLSLSKLVVIIALPFTPAFVINILAGVSKMKKEKFLLALMIGKVFMILFWGYVGKSFIESMTDITTLMILTIMLAMAYFLSRIVSKKANIE